MYLICVLMQILKRSCVLVSLCEVYDGLANCLDYRYFVSVINDKKYQKYYVNCVELS